MAEELRKLSDVQPLLVWKDLDPWHVSNVDLWAGIAEIWKLRKPKRGGGGFSIEEDARPDLPSEQYALYYML